MNVSIEDFRNAGFRFGDSCDVTFSNGFVCMLLEALSGASYDEMLSDYMITYDNYYHVTQDSASEKYDAIVDLYFNAFAAYLHGTEDLAVLKTADYTQDAENYLLSGGMTSEEITALRDLITE